MYLPLRAGIAALGSCILLASCGGPQLPSARPAAPTNVQAAAKAGTIEVTWTDNSSNEAGFKVYRSVTTPGSNPGSSQSIGETAANETRFVDVDVSPGSTYVYEVSAFNATGESQRAKQANSPVAPTPTHRTLNVSLRGSGSGSVNSSPAGIACGTDCSEVYPEGTTVVLTATPDVGSTIASWSGGCTGTSLTCSVTITSDQMVTAEFVKLPPAPEGKQTLAVSISGSGAGSVVSDPAGIDCGDECVANYDQGTLVTLTAVPAPGTQFGGWTGACSGSAASCQVTMNAARSVNARFIAYYQVSVAKSGDGSGTVSSTPSGISCGQVCSASFEEGAELVLTATPAAGSVFEGWSGGGCTGTGTCTLTVGASTSVTASFSRVPLALTVEVDGPGRVTSSPAGIDCGSDCSEQYSAGTQVALTAVPSSGAEFLGWSGSCGGTSTICVVTMDSSKSVTARFGDTAIVVTSTVGTKSGPECTLRAAIDAANTDSPVGGCRAGNGADVIRLPEGRVFELLAVDNTTNGRNGLPSITSRITIQGNGSTVQRGATEQLFRVFHVGLDGYLTLEGLTVKNGDGDTFGGGGIYVAGGQLELIGSVVSDNLMAETTESRGGGIYGRDAVISIRESQITRNGRNESGMAGDSTGGAIALVDSDLTIRSSTVTWNKAGYTAGIDLRGEHSTTDIEDSRIENNEGLGLRNEGSLWLSQVAIRGNAQGEGYGGIVNTGTAYLSNVTYERNTGEFGGSLKNIGFMEITGSTIHRNSAVEDGRGGGIYNRDRMEIHDSVISENNAAGSWETGGGIHNDGELLVTGTRIVGNVSNEGGGIWNEGSLTLVDSIVDGNRALWSGGGIVNFGWLRLAGSTTIGGELGNSADFGGGIQSGLDWLEDPRSTVRLEDAASIRNNRATRDGGGIHAHGFLNLDICETCSVTANRADSDGDGTGAGGGLYASQAYLDASTAARVFDNTPDDIAPGGTLRVRVASSQDDAEEFRSATTNPPLPAGSVYYDGQDLELTYDPGSGLRSDQFVGIRFRDLQIPAGARIVAAHLQFTTDETGSGATSVRIRLQDSVAPAPFERGEGSYSISSRPLRSEYRDWTPEPWTVVNESGPKQRTPDMSYMVQQVVKRADWTSGSSLAFVIAGTQLQGPGATRTAFAYDGDPAKAPMLVITYFDPP